VKDIVSDIKIAGLFVGVGSLGEARLHEIDVAELVVVATGTRVQTNGFFEVLTSLCEIFLLIMGLAEHVVERIVTLELQQRLERRDDFVGLVVH